MLDHSSMMFPETAHFSGRVVHDNYYLSNHLIIPKKAVTERTPQHDPRTTTPNQPWL